MWLWFSIGINSISTGSCSHDKHTSSKSNVDAKASQQEKPGVLVIALTIYTAFSAYLLTAQIGVIYLANAALRSAKMSTQKYITLDNKHHIHLK